jgi:hypothetical protein
MYVSTKKLTNYINLDLKVLLLADALRQGDVSFTIHVFVLPPHILALGIYFYAYVLPQEPTGLYLVPMKNIP